MQLFYITKNHSHLEMILDAHTGQSTMATHRHPSTSKYSDNKRKKQASSKQNSPEAPESHPAHIMAAR